MRITWNRFIVASVFSTVVINEYVVYWLQSWNWPILTNKKGDGVVILLVSDLQLQGVQNEHMFPVGTLARWDSDRYLHTNFVMAMSHVDPDIVVYLGDLFDEGSKATDDEYSSYFSRFHQIFARARTKQNIYLPGDNDIGGEGSDMRSANKLARFEQHFAPAVEAINYTFLTFVKLDLFSLRFTKRMEQLKLMELQSPYRVMLAHDTVLSKRKQKLFHILQLLQPRLIFSGHWHESEHSVCKGCMEGSPLDDIWPLSIADLPDIVSIDLNLDTELHEIQVPTCSYRMGVRKMGYGVAHISPKGILSYHVLWIPGRYALLYSYIIILSVLALLSFCRLICCTSRKPLFYR